MDQHDRDRLRNLEERLQSIHDKFIAFAAEMKPVKAVVYGMISIILIAVMATILAKSLHLDVAGAEEGQMKVLSP